MDLLSNVVVTGLAVIGIGAAAANLAFVKDKGKTIFASLGGRILFSGIGLLGSSMLLFA